MALKPWWEEQPERLRWEYDWLEYEGYEYEEASRDQSSGTLELRVKYPADDQVLSLEVIFPPFFPDVRPEVRCADVQLPHHQNPVTKELCLLGRSTSLWDPAKSLAAFLKEQMPQVLKAGATEDALLAGALEEHQAEPATAFLATLADSEIIIATDAEFGPGASGRFAAKIGIAPNGGDFLVKGVVCEVNAAACWTPQADVLQNLLGWSQQVHGRWFSLANFQSGLNAAQFVESAVEQMPEVGRTTLQFNLKGDLCELLLFRVPSEVGHRTIGSEWIMVLRRTPQGVSRRHRVVRHDYVKVERFGRDLIYQRAPELSTLSQKKIALVGLGCIGAPAALEFAKAAVGELRLLDVDTVEAGTLVRWPIGLPYVGSSKVGGLGNFIGQNFPLTRRVLRFGRVGGIPTNSGVTLDAMREFVDGVDLIFDATAELGVSSILSHVASDLRVPMISIASTNGGWGGTVITSEPGKSGCYDCFLRHVQEGLIVLPPGSKTERVQPVGCAEPTYLAANFDTGEIALAGVRTAVSVLTAGIAGGYPELTRGAAVLKLREADGRPIYPTWTTYELRIHPGCRFH